MEGKCLCGAISIKADELQELEACHCGMCIRWGSGPLFAIVYNSSIGISGREFISTYSSSDWAERAFCKQCGTHLYYHLKSTSKYVVCAGLFTNQESFEIKEQIYTDCKPSFYSLSNKTIMLTEAQVIEKYTSK